VDRQVERVIAADVKAAERVIDGKRQVGQRTARERGIGRRTERAAPVPPGCDLRILDDCSEVVENERRIECSRVDDAREEDDEQRAPPDASGRIIRRSRWPTVSLARYFPNPQIASCGGSAMAA
jgi:hypothetical protein